MSGYQAEAYLPPTRARLYREAGATSLKHAIIVTGGKQYRVVSGNVVKNGKSKKIRVYKMKPKKGYRRTQGHRQPYTKVEITKIEA